MANILLNAEAEIYRALQRTIEVESRRSAWIGVPLRGRKIRNIVVPDLRGQLSGRIQLQVVKEVVLLVNPVEDPDSSTKRRFSSTIGIIGKPDPRHDLDSAVVAQALRILWIFCKIHRAVGRIADAWRDGSNQSGWKVGIAGARIRRLASATNAYRPQQGH